MAERIIKPWGWSQEVYRDELTRVVRIHVKPGGFCSWHKHERQDNAFLVLSGELTINESIRESRDGHFDELLSGQLEAGMTLSVIAGVVHRFINILDRPVDALEIYTASELSDCDPSPPDENDIVRFSEGGVAKQ